ncbi:TPA: hypothetical protein ACGBG5_001716 [Enterococcus faecalis]
MPNEVIIAFIGLAGSAIGTFGGVVTSAKLTNYKIDDLRKRVDKHNEVVERTFKLEGRMREAEHDIRDLKEEEKR